MRERRVKVPQEPMVAHRESVDSRYPESALTMINSLDVQSRRIGIAIGATVAKMPELIHHYTSTASLLKILESAQLWLTHINFTNDVREFHHGCDVIGELIDVHLAERRPGAELAALERLKPELARTKDETALFVASFSAGGDKLSQWRGYAPEGVALGFSPVELQSHAGAPGFMLYPCIYDRAQQTAIGQVCMEVFFNAIKQFPASLTPDVRERAEAIVFEAIVTTVAPILKHETFKEEEEWRLFTAPYHVQGGELVFSVSGRHLVPHIPLPLKVESGQNLVRTVTVGPPPVADSALTGLLWSLVQNGFEGTSVLKSGITYRQL